MIEYTEGMVQIHLNPPANKTKQDMPFQLLTFYPTYIIQKE